MNILSQIYGRKFKKSNLSPRRTRVGQSYPNYLIAKFASQKVKVIFRYWW